MAITHEQNLNHSRCSIHTCIVQVLYCFRQSNAYIPRALQTRGAALQFWKEGLYFALLICNVELHLKYLQFLAFFCKESFFQVRLVVGGGVSEKREEDKQLNILPRAAQQKTFVFHEDCFWSRLK